MFKRTIILAGASVFIATFLASSSGWAQTSATTSSSRHEFVTALPPEHAQTVTAIPETTTVHPSTSHTTPPARLSSALGLGPQSRFHINGFLSAGAAWTNSSANYIIPSHGTIDNKINASPLSLVGLQFTADIAHHLQAVTQLVGDGDNTNGNVAYRVNVEWAFIRYVISDNYQIRVGRFRLPAFLYSETEQVGFSYPWVLLPNEVYRIVPFNNINGINFVTRYAIGSTGWNITMGPYYGSNKSKYTVYNAAAPDGATVDFKENSIAGMVIRIGNKNITLRGTYANLKLTATSEGISPFIPSTVLFVSDATRYYALGLKFLLDKFLLVAEFADRSTPSRIAALQGFYGSLGYKFGKLLPLFTYARITTRDASELTIKPNQSELPQDQESFTLGLDYTLNSNLDIKASISQISALKGTFGLFNSNPLRKHVYLYGLSLDAIF